MSSSFHTLEEGMKITLYLMFLREPFAFPTSCSLRPLRLRGGRSASARLRSGAAPLRGRAANAGATACPSFHVQNTTGLEGRGGCVCVCATEDSLRRSRLAFPRETQVQGGSRESCPPPRARSSFGYAGEPDFTWRSAPKGRSAGSQGGA